MGNLRTSQTSFVSNLKFDFPASIVVFLVALPLCLGIAIASDAPAFSGVISGIIGGIVVGILSGSNVSVSGPAAGLTSIVTASIATLGNAFDAFLVAVVLAGIFQVAFGVLRAGFLAQFVPNSVIRGMLAGIGLILILKQIPHAFGYDKDYEGDFSFSQNDHENTFSELWNMLGYLNAGATIIAFTSLAILLLWETKFFKRIRIFQLIPAALIAVVAGVLLNEAFRLWLPELVVVDPEHLVQIPRIDFSAGMSSFTTFPDFAALGKGAVWLIAIQIALVASLESLLSLEATDKIDPFRRASLPNKELRAQGIGNILAGLIGGIPVTAVIVRSSANISAGSRTRTSAILHGVLLLFCVLAIPGIINRIPFSALAAVLLTIGYKLTKPALFKEEFKAGYNKFIPFVVTIGAILFTNLLLGIGVGIVAGMIFTFIGNYSSAISVTRQDSITFIKFKKDLYFVNKPKIKKIFVELENSSDVILDMQQAEFIDPDIIEIINEFITQSKERNIRLEIKKPLNVEYEKIIKQEHAAV